MNKMNCRHWSEFNIRVQYFRLSLRLRQKYTIFLYQYLSITIYQFLNKLIHMFVNKYVRFLYRIRFNYLSLTSCIRTLWFSTSLWFILSYIKCVHFVSVYKQHCLYWMTFSLTVMQGHAKKTVNEPIFSILIQLRCWETYLHHQERMLFITKLANATKACLLVGLHSKHFIRSSIFFLLELVYFPSLNKESIVKLKLYLDVYF